MSCTLSLNVPQHSENLNVHNLTPKQSNGAGGLKDRFGVVWVVSDCQKIGSYLSIDL